MGIVYLGALLLSLCCMLLIDRRYRLFFWRDPIAAGLVTVAGVAFFLAWDIAGIAQGIFLRGDAPISTGILLAPELPVEEPVFLLFLVVCTMVVYAGAVRVLSRGRRTASAEGAR